MRSLDPPFVRTLYETWAGVFRCKLRMLRTAPQPAGWRLGPALAGSLTLRLYPSFRSCASLGRVRLRIAAEPPESDRWGIHVMASQTAAGEIAIGDSHECGDTVGIFNREEIDAAILDYLRLLLNLPAHAVAERWHGVYAKHADAPFVRFEPRAGRHCGHRCAAPASASTSQDKCPMSPRIPSHPLSAP